MRTSLLLISLLILHLVHGFVASSRGTTAVVFRPQRRLPTSQHCPPEPQHQPQQQQLQRQNRRPQQQQQGESIRRSLLSVGAVAPGGGSSGSEVANQTTKGKCPFTATMRLLSTTWGVLGVVYILAKAVVRVAPIALEPFQAGSVPLQQWQLALYIVTCLWFAYVEGYKGFQTKFAPLVVKRAFTLVPGQSRLHHFLFAPLYCMGLLFATKKRLIVSWSVTAGVTAVVAAVKRLPYPYRNIIDAGVVAGLTWGGLSILLLYGKALVTGTLPSIDPALPESSSAAIKKK